MPVTHSQKTPILESVASKSSSTSTRKTLTKRARSPEPTRMAQTDATQPRNKRSKQAKSATTSSSPTKSRTPNPATTQPVATESSPNIQADPKHPPPPNYTGNFDLYAMDLPFLSKVYLPKGTSTPQYEELYKTILKYQAKDDNTAQFYLASPADADAGSIFQSQTVMDPMEELPFDIAIQSVKHHPSLSLPSNKLFSAMSDSIPDGPGISALTALEDSHCSIQSAAGLFKLKRVWTKAVSGGDFVELFEGYFSFKVSHSGLYRRKGHGTGENHQWMFWAVRVRKGNDGKEMGLRPILPISVNAKVEAPAMHPMAPAAVGADTVTVKQPNMVEPSSGSPKFAGNFDLYSMCDLIEEGQVPREPFPQCDEVYDAIINSNPGITAQCYLGAPVSPYDEDEFDLGSDDADANVPASMGQFRGPTICDPFVEQLYNVIITSIEAQDSLAFTEELDQFPTRDSDPSGPGMTAQLELAGSGHPGVDSASGYIKFVRLWTKAGPNGELLEVFEAYLNLEVVFEWDFRFRGHGRSENNELAFWAVRAKKDHNGQEIGLSSQPEETSHFC